MSTGKIGVSTGNLFPIIKKFLYSDHEIFLREIVSNAVDASQKMKVLASNGEFKGELGELKVRVKADKAAGTLTVSDNGIGMTGEQLEQLRQNLVSEEPSAGGVGLQNLYRRLKLLYGEDARLNIDAKELQGTTVSFIIPLEREEEHVSSAAGR